MRLHRLQMTAFQPFAGTEEVDFEALGEAGLFLMQGETGAGKTAILDAICFALFGHVPGVRDGAGRLRSDHGAAEDRTEVVLELTLAGRRLRITRSPKQERAKVRGEGKTEEPARAVLQARTQAGEWAVLAERIEAVEHELAEMLGLSIGQFCQVVMLPQGAFAKFLHATTDEREQILQQLFATDRYAAAEAWLADQRRLADTELRLGLETVGDVASRIAQVCGEEPPEGWRGEPECLRGWLGARTVLADAGEAAAAGRRDAACQARERAAVHAGAVRGLAERQQRHAVATAALVAHEAQRPEREQAALRVEAARRAEPAALLAEPARAARAASLRAERTAREAVEQASGQLTGAAAPELGAEQARERAAELRQQAVLARAWTESEERLSRDERAIAQSRDELADAVAIVQEQRRRLADAGPERERLQTDLDAARTAAAALPGLRQAKDQSARCAQAATRRDQLLAQARQAADRITDARAAELAARQRWLDARERRLAGIAAELAGELGEGQPCRVCGATEHPAPARHEAGQRVDATHEQDLQQQLDVAAREHERERERGAELRRELAGVQAIAGARLAEELAQAGHAADVRLAEQQRLAEGLAMADQALSEHVDRVAQGERWATEAAERSAALRTGLARREEDLRRAATQVREARDGFATIAARLGHLETLATDWFHAAQALERARAAAREAEQRAAEAGEAALTRGFVSAEDALAAALASAECERMQRQVGDYDERHRGLRALTEDPELVGAAVQPAADERRAQAALVEAEAELTEAQRAQAVAERTVGELRALADDLEARLQALSPLSERQRLVRSVSGLVDGSSVANRMRMPLAAYVLTARLEQIAQAASGRLERMSGGRYVLAHCDVRVGRSRKAGLGLQVLDAWTGRERPPGSLSGGETFQASLGLALGLADVVTAESGATRLETLFVDEGFGSLGDGALDDVLDVLDGLREGGRAVGVISHVAELRQRIPVQLHVEKRRQGSRIVQR